MKTCGAFLLLISFFVSATPTFADDAAEAAHKDAKEAIAKGKEKPDEKKEELKDKDTPFTEVESVEKAIGDVDVIYMEPVVQADYTQSRVERTGQEGMTPKEYQVTRDLLKQAKRSAIVLHSLPRMDELTTDVDETRHQRYWVEAFNGVVMRMALLSLVLGAIE